jgi:hypothetical protein
MPVIGFLSSRSAGESASVVAAFSQGLNEAKLAISRARMWRSNSAGRRDNLIDCRQWLSIWSAVRWR